MTDSTHTAKADGLAQASSLRSASLPPSLKFNFSEEERAVSPPARLCRVAL
jgi:hypothetical protein